MVARIIDKNKASRTNLIFVHLGQASLLNTECMRDFIADNESFNIEGNEHIFDKKWFSEVFITLKQEKEYHLLSFAQFSYLIHYIDPSFFSDRIVIVKDNLRQLYPIRQEDYLEYNDDENPEERPATLPIYQAEQVIINGKYYFSAKMPVDAFETHEIFTESKELVVSSDKGLRCIDVNSDPHSLDEFINDCIEHNNFSERAVARFNNKQRQNPAIVDILERLNALLSVFGGILSIQEEKPILPDYQPSSVVQQILVRYWGVAASFRCIPIYKNPSISNEVIELSQGVVVETIINEYEKSAKGLPSRDLFLTAPTGAGKSLLFQLPAFYISEKHDVTIVVSPLIALMKDQVDAIKAIRGFDKAAYINSELNLVERERIINDCKNRDIDVLYMSPELLLSYDISHFIGDRRLGLLVIDEAHLITTWGRDFRVDYWFLGSHIRKIRKCHNLDFPMVAVTATAIYGGANDMVFDSIDSLAMHNPHIFIGGVKRNNIEFLVNTYEKFSMNYESNKITQTVDFIKKIHVLGLKTLIYAPYTAHIRKILIQVNANIPGVATGYYGTLDPLEKEYAYRQFKGGEKKVMISTKAFGMGVDISDIQVVYHHAPSGLLPDYVQEIGRVARIPEMQGYAALNYSSQDQRYTRALHGMSAIRQYQIKAVLKKIYNTYILNNKNRNLLLSVDDFGHIFNNPTDIDQKLLTALMMIEKDYLIKNRFNVIIARPKKLFAKVYARVSREHLDVLENTYCGTYRVLSHYDNSNTIIQIDLDQLWKEHFIHKSFPAIKYLFFKGDLLKDIRIRLIPQLKLSYILSKNYNAIFSELTEAFDLIKSALSSIHGYFKKDDLKKTLNNILHNPEKAEKLSRFILSSYSGTQIRPGVIEVNAFLQERKSIDGIEYRVFGERYLACFSILLNTLHQLFNSERELKAERFVTNNEANAIDYIRLGFFIEILELGSFEVMGGENPMVFIRINDPDRVGRDSRSPNYQNLLLAKTLERHDLSNQIYDHFFLRQFTNDDRWGFIEDYFLGLDIDSILQKYPGHESNKIDIIDYLRNQDLALPDNGDDREAVIDLDIFTPTPKSYYSINDPLTISDEHGLRTKTISEWLDNDPVALDKLRRSTPFSVDNEVFKILVSKLRANHSDYQKRVLGLKYMIEFKGYDKLVHAAVPYMTKPVDFYKWWCSNPERVLMSKEEMMHLFRKVYQLNKSVLKREHQKILGKV